MLVSTMVTVLGLAFVIGILSHSFQRQLMNELKKEAVFISRGVEAAGTDYLDQLSNTDSRITYVDESGKVLYDNEADVENMENHGHRKEIREAELNGEGEDERMSSTLSEKTMYYALRLDNGNVLRVSSTQKSAFALVWQLVPPLLGVLFLILVLSAVFASRLSGRVVEPLNNLDLEHPEEINVYEEVEPLISKIYRQNRQIRLQLEAARRQQKEFSIITENMQEGLLVIDSYTMILSGNSSAWKLFQLKDPKIGDSVYSLNRNEDFRLLIEQVLKGQHGSVLLHMGSEAIQMIANPVNREHRVVGAVILLMNETEKVEREQLRREFSANVSHELKTPLTSISGFAEIIQDGLVKEEDIKKFAGRIYNEAQRLITLVEDTIKVSQLDEGENPYEWEMLDAYTIVKDVCGRLREVAEKKNVHLYIDGGKTMLTTVHPILDEVIYNLCDNGIKYNKEDGTVSIHLRDLGENVEIRVKDNGIGIPGEDQSRVFERFYRVDKSHSKSSGGTGLGLSIVKHAVQYHHGKIELTSAPGKGTSITVSFTAIQ